MNEQNTIFLFDIIKPYPWFMRFPCPDFPCEEITNFFGRILSVLPSLVSNFNQMDQQNQSNKTHRASKDPKKGNKSKLHANGFNAKAFSVSAPGKLERQARRTSDVSELLGLTF